MKFTDGFWLPRPDTAALFAQQIHDVWVEGEGVLTAYATTRTVERRGDLLDRAVLTVRLSSPLENVIRVHIEHHAGARPVRRFELPGAVEGVGQAQADAGGGSLRSGALTARFATADGWSLTFDADGRHLTGSGRKSVGHHTLTSGETFVHEQLELGVGEHVYGLGERFGPLVKNGQTVDIWNADGGTSSEQAYKNVPFYLTDRGYGILVDDPGRVSFEVGSENVQRVQFSVPGESLDYLVIYGPAPKQILERYTALTGRPPAVPAWSYGLWLSTSFTTDYDEATVTSFIEGMADRGIPLSTFHFDCFWMREFNWCDFEWDPRTFPDPEGMLARLHERGLRVCVWINPYIGQRSPLFAEGAAAGYLLRRPDGSVWQWDRWQPGMGILDVTNPDAVHWFQEKLRRLVRMGVDAFKTDFGERIPTDVVYADGSDPERMHNLYAQLYNRAVADVLEQERGVGEAVLFARSATTGGQSMPVHWGGDSTSTYASMAETLRGGLSLAMSGFAHWSHDIGGFEGTPDAGVFKRWVAFGLLSSHSRLHGSSSYRVPWQFDDEAVEVLRIFTRLKLSLLPYLLAAGEEARLRGTPLLRPMALEFPDDPSCAYLDTQYLLGPDLLVAPVFRADGSAEVYLPAGRWTDAFSGEIVHGGGWRHEQRGFLEVPLYVREGAVLPRAARADSADQDLFDGLVLEVYPPAPGAPAERAVQVVSGDGRSATVRIRRADGTVTAVSDDLEGFTLRVVGGGEASASGGRAETVDRPLF